MVVGWLVGRWFAGAALAGSVGLFLVCCLFVVGVLVALVLCWLCVVGVLLVFVCDLLVHCFFRLEDW